MHASSEPVVDTPENPNDISISDAETQSSNEHEPSDNVNNDVHVNAQPSIDNDVETEPAVDLDNPQSKNQCYDKRDFIARKHGKERYDEEFERFVGMLRPVFLRLCLTGILKISPYAKYMKDIVTNRRKIPKAEITTMLANYTFKGGIPKKLWIPEYQLCHAPLKEKLC